MISKCGKWFASNPNFRNVMVVMEIIQNRDLEFVNRENLKEDVKLMK